MTFVDIFLQNPIWQLFGFAAMIVAFIGFLQKDDTKTLQIIIIAMFFWVCHFYIMWVYSAFVASIIWIFRIFLSLKYKKNKRIFLGIISATLVFWVITYENSYSLLPIIGSCISAYWYFFFERIRLRMFMFVTSLFWFSFNLSTWSIGWIINEVMIQIILIIAMYKMIHEEWKRVFFVDKVISILQHPKPDVWRFINIYDLFNIKRKNIKQQLLQNVKIVKTKLGQKFKHKKSS